MAGYIDIVDLAHELAEVARTTTDPETGRLLTKLIERLLEEAGLPPDDPGGGAPPTRWISDMADAPA